MLRTHNCGELRKEDAGKSVTLCGWLASIRDYGNFIFLNLRDRYGITQIVVEDKNLMEKARKLGLEYVLKIKGKVRERPKGMINPNLPTGEIEVVAEEIEILSECKMTPFVVRDDVKVRDDIRMKYRYLDLRRPKHQYPVIFKSKVMKIIRDFLADKDFLEIETPLLAKSTPEGARDFLVPSRLNPGKFYALAQSPQLYKQILMVAGFDKYYQIAKCLRDEDLRADRQPEFLQLDIEMSFCDEEDIFNLIEEMMKKLFKECLNFEIETPFKRLTYKEAIEKYGSDKPDTRFNLFLEDITEIAKKSDLKIFKDAEKVIMLRWDGELSRKEIDELLKIAEKPVAWIKYKDGEKSGPIAKYFDITPLNPQSPSVFFFCANKWGKAHTPLGLIRRELVKKLKTDKKFEFVWITDFPLFEWNEDERRWQPCHHIFTMPKVENIEKINFSNPDKIIAKQYDLVLNGVELGSGSIRIHHRDLQEKVMQVLGMTKEEIERNFGFLLTALEYGAPPHGGIALGIDRLCVLMLGLQTIQDTIPFPKTARGQGLMEEIPSEVLEEQLKELGIKIENAES